MSEVQAVQAEVTGPSDHNISDVRGLLGSAMYQIETCLALRATGKSGASDGELVARLVAAHYMVQRAQNGSIPDNYKQALGVAAAYDALAEAYDNLLQADVDAELAQSEGVGIAVETEAA